MRAKIALLLLELLRGNFFMKTGSSLLAVFLFLGQNYGNN